MSGKPITTSTRSRGLATSASSACNVSAQVPSEPTSARAHVEAVLRQELVEVVARDAPLDFREAIANQIAVLVGDALQLFIDLALPPTKTYESLSWGRTRNECRRR
jgi:hypothetical protein